MISLPIRWWTAGHQAFEACLVVAVADSGQVVDQGVVPDVEDVRSSQGTGTPHFVDIRVIEMSLSPPFMKLSASLRFDGGSNGVGLGLVPLDETVLEGAQLEEVVLLFEPLDRDRRWSGQTWPSSSSDSSLYASHPTQYQPA